MSAVAGVVVGLVTGARRSGLQDALHRNHVIAYGGKIVRLGGITAVGCRSRLSVRTSREEKSHVTQEHPNAMRSRPRLFVV
jgi:hypothetical protein